MNDAAKSPSLSATHRAWVLYDWANSGFATVMLTAVFPVYFIAQVPATGLTLPGLPPLPASALWGYMVSGSMLLVAVLAPWLGAIADFGGHRNRFLTILGTLGALATLTLGLSPWSLLPLALLFLLANLGFAGGNLFYNALLPQITTTGNLDRLSSRGYAIGYIGGGLVLLAGFVLIQWHGSFGLADKGAASRLLIVLTGLWWLLFALPCFYRVKDRTQDRSGQRTAYGQTFRELARHRNALRFLLAFLCYNDGIQTLITISSVFAVDELGLGQSTILGCFLMIQFVAMPGTYLCQQLAERIGTRKTLLATLLLFTLITAYAWTMHSSWQFWLLGVLVALVLGGSQALSRSLFARLIPPEKSAEFFGFFAISNKFASILGPLTFALFAHLTGSTRNAVLSLTLFFIVGGLLLLGVAVPAADGDDHQHG